MIFISIIFNILLGLSIGLIMSSMVRKKYIFHGPNSVKVQKKIFTYKNKCYKLVPYIVKCGYFNYHIS